MKELRKIDLEYEAYSSADDLLEPQSDLLSRAKGALETAYAPYSKFHVGAAVEMVDGQIIVGNNQENVAYPSGLCAERVALFYAAASNPGLGIKRVAVSARSNEFLVDYAITPCGACRQALLEYEKVQGEPIEVILAGATGEIIVVPSISWLLPLSFFEHKLKK